MYANTKGKNPGHNLDKDPTVSDFQTLETLKKKKKHYIYIYTSSESAREWRTALIERRLVNQSVSLLPDWSIASFDG